jgi:starch-binding outer membrane protein, SusD/RagB family
MKKYFFLYTIIAAGCLATACTKKIDLKPDFQLDGSKPLASLEEAENVLTGAYNGFLSDGYYDANGAVSGGPYSLFPDIMSDDLIETNESLGNYRSVAEWSYVPNDPYINNTWLSTYSVVSSVNIILRDIDALSSENAGAANRIKAQALAIRAHVHFDLLRYFAPSFDRNAADLGVAYVKEYDPTARPARNTVKECYDNILVDLSAAEAAFANIDKAVNSVSSRSRIDLTAVKAMQARVNLYAGQWQDAANAAGAAISSRSLAAINTFPAIWEDESVAEVIWSAAFETLTDGAPYDNVYFVRGNRSTYKPASALVSLYNQANDVRYSTYFATVGDLNGVPKAPRLVVAKHIGRPGSSNLNGVVNWKVFRTSEMYLIRAEANYRLNKENEARNDLNALRTVRISGFTPGAESGTALLNAILLERRKELFAEGHRFFDLKRLNKTAINRCASNGGSPSTICSLTTNNRAWAWPIPFNEIIANSNMTQNAGY